jgi:hypothetical protein
MKLVTGLLALPVLMALGAAAQAACVYPQAPKSLPNGSRATKEEMLAAQTEVKAYSKDVQEVYLPCLEKEKDEQIAALDSADPDYAARKSAIEALQIKKHNAALDELSALANSWGQELKAFSSAQKN